MKHLLIILLLTTMGKAQSISKQVIGTSGRTLNSTNFDLKVTYTVGEPLVGLMTAGGNQLGNGYYNSMDLKALSVEDNTLNMDLKLYPNPTSQSLYLTHSEMNSFRIQITDLNRKQIYKGTINKEEPLDVSNYTQGIYIITIENSTTNKKNTYIIIKK